jgi:uncharacterized protein
VTVRADTLDLARLQLRSGEGRRLEFAVPLDPLELSAEHYTAQTTPVPAVFDVSRMAAGGWSVHLRATVGLEGPCMRCLTPAAPSFPVDSWEVHEPGGGEDLESPYVDDAVMDLRAWLRDALVLDLPVQILCRPDCAGLCAVCGLDLNADPDHEHEAAPDPRWEKLSELDLG